MENLIKELKKLNEDELSVVFLDLLTSNKLSFQKLSELYVFHLERKERKLYHQIQKLSESLVMYWTKQKESKFTRAKSAYHLLHSNVFRTAKIEADFKGVLEKDSYTEDEEGHHTFIEK